MKITEPLDPKLEGKGKMQTPGQICGLSGSERSSTAITEVIVLFGIFFCTSHTIQTAVIDEKQQDTTEEAIDPSIQALAKITLTLFATLKQLSLE